MVVSKSIFRASKSSDVIAWLLLSYPPTEYQMGMRQLWDSSKWVRGGSGIFSMLCVIIGGTSHRHLAPRLSWPHNVSLWGLPSVKQKPEALNWAHLHAKVIQWNKISVRVSRNSKRNPLPKWVYARMHEHSVQAEWQVENQQVISTDSVPYPS